MASVQQLTGRIWLDLDRDGAADAGEPGLPDVGVTATVGGSDLLRRTDSSGSFRFAGIAAGATSLLATPPAGLSVTADSDGSPDARAELVVPVGGSSDAWVGLVGEGRITALVGGAGDTSVLMRWFGTDDVLRTPDDVVLRLQARNGTLTTRGLPPGTYRVEQVGSSPRATVLEVRSGRTTRATVTEPARARGALPFTGTPVAALVLSALCLVAAGAALRVLAAGDRA